MALHDEFLNLARRMVPPLAATSSAPGMLVGEADLRRGVSTAYYALFHLLVHKAMMRIVADPTLRARVGRSFDHTRMKQVCQEYSAAKLVDGVYKLGTGAEIAPQLQGIGTAFVLLQQARHDADYDTSQSMAHADADLHVQIAESAFLDWAVCETDPSTGLFLTELFIKCVVRR